MRLLSIIAKLLSGLLLAFSMLMLASCSRMPIEQIDTTNTALDLEEFFLGETYAYGIFEDRNGSLRRQFRVLIDGRMEDGKLVLDERFLYADGETARRIWTIENLGNDGAGKRLYSGSAADIEGEATGAIIGNTLNWQYDITLDIGSTALKVHFDDWIFRQHEDLAINRAYVTKFGVLIGSVTLVFLRGRTAEAMGPPDLKNW